LIVGFGPDALGYVYMFCKANAAGAKLFTLKVINAFLTGRKPVDYSYLNPNIIILISESLYSIVEHKSTFLGLYL
jgi:hypothetical protein